MAAPITLSTLLLLLAATANSAKTTQTTNTDTNTDTTAEQTTTKAASTSQVTVTSLPNLNSAAASSGSSAAGSSISITDAPSITTTGIQFSLTGSVPTIAGVGPVTQIVPDTSRAPFMQKSNLPEGSVFIIVGAILGFMGLAILAWRLIIAWSLRKLYQRAQELEELEMEEASDINNQADRSVQRAAKRDYTDLKEKPNRKGVYGKGGDPLSTVSLDRLNPSHRTSEPPRLSRSSHGRPVVGANPAAARNSNLFFSPTAGAGTHSTPSASPFPTNRSSTFLPAGYYSSPSASSAAGGAPTTVIGGTPPPLPSDAPSRLSHLNPLSSGAARAGYTAQRNFGPSPPASPVLPASRRSADDMRRYGSGGGDASSTVGNIGARAPAPPRPGSSSLNLHVPGGAPLGQRAPSANLEDLFDQRGAGPRY